MPKRRRHRNPRPRHRPPRAPRDRLRPRARPAYARPPHLLRKIRPNLLLVARGRAPYAW
ncbi:hypothetical protein GBP346_A1466 [Burkholderia pseudomallei MSHR346]|nr:hypothetical protein GBP346_A1466 [Burkholderia pseudomallei MSHR346]